VATAPDLDLSIIIVSWNVRNLLGACLTSLRETSGITWVGAFPVLPDPDPGGPVRAAARARDGAAPEAMQVLRAEVIVVDNASSDGTAALVAEAFPWARLVANTDNRGFTGGNNQGMALSRGRHVFFLNPDTEVPGDALIRLVTYIDGHPAVGAVGPELRYGDGTPQGSRRRFPTLAMALCESTPLAWHWPQAHNQWAQRYHLEDRPSGREPEPVDWLVGAALLVRRTAIDQVGGFDEGYFMYSEELDWCRRAAAEGWQIVYLPGTCVIHHEGKSSEQVVAARHIRFQTSKVRYFRKFHGPVPATVLRAILLAMFAGEWLLEGAKWLAGSRRYLRAERMAAYNQLLRSGLKAKG
jgi:N-acetylglucosaminyl-diphospho-decaprenol L-rhamnosyltransferase